MSKIVCIRGINEAHAEAIQRIAFSFGFHWVGIGPETVRNLDAYAFYFHPWDRSITYSNQQFYDSPSNEEAYVAVENLVDLVKFFKQTTTWTPITDGSAISARNGELKYGESGLLWNEKEERALLAILKEKYGN
jgi:hypothetical protein